MTSLIEVRQDELVTSPRQSTDQFTYRQRISMSFVSMTPIAQQSLMKNLFITATLGFLVMNANASDSGITEQEIYAKVQQADAKVLLLDVSDPVEIMFVDFTDAVHANVPYLIVDPTGWDDKRGIYKLTQNPLFAVQMKAKLEMRGLGNDAEIIALCHSGSERGEPSASFLCVIGFSNARYVINGFQRTTLKEGTQAGMRPQNGWQNSGLPCA